MSQYLYSPETLVTMADSTHKPIADIHRGDHVMLANGTPARVREIVSDVVPEFVVRAQGVDGIGNSFADCLMTHGRHEASYILNVAVPMKDKTSELSQLSFDNLDARPSKTLLYTTSRAEALAMKERMASVFVACEILSREQNDGSKRYRVMATANAKWDYVAGGWKGRVRSVVCNDDREMFGLVLGDEEMFFIAEGIAVRSCV